MLDELETLVPTPPSKPEPPPVIEKTEAPPPIIPVPPPEPVWIEERWPARASKDEKEEAVKMLVAEMRRTRKAVSILPRNGTILVAESAGKEIVVYECEVQRRLVFKG